MAAGKACPLFRGCAVGDKSTQKVLESEGLSKPVCAQTMTWPPLPPLCGARRGAVVCELLPEGCILHVHSSKIYKLRNLNSLSMPSWIHGLRRVSRRLWHCINVSILISFREKIWWRFLFFLLTGIIELWDNISHNFENHASKLGY